MEKPTLVILAAGMGSRYGGLKQIDTVGNNGESIIDFSIYDAKEAGFEVTDKIKVSYEGTEKAESIFAAHAEEIGKEVLATEVIRRTPGGYTKEWNINGEKVALGVEK